MEFRNHASSNDSYEAMKDLVQGHLEGKYTCLFMVVLDREGHMDNVLSMNELLYPIHIKVVQALKDASNDAFNAILERHITSS